MQCNYNQFIQIINFHGLFHNALRCQKTGGCQILVPLRYLFNFYAHLYTKRVPSEGCSNKQNHVPTKVLRLQ